MSYNLVRKGESVILVKKFRNGEGKVKEQYITSLGVMNDAEFKNIKQRCYEYPQDKRVAFCLQSGLVKEVAEDIPRRKVQTRDIREQPIKKERKPRKQRTVKEQKQEWLRYPETGYRAIHDPERAEHALKKVERPMMSKEQIDTRIGLIKKDIKFSKEVIAQKQKVKIFTATQRASVHEAIEYHQSVIDAGTQAIKILKKQKKEMK